MSSFLKNIALIIGLLAVQVLILDQLNFGMLNSFVNPIIISATIFFLPVGISTNRLLILAFIIGIALDSFHNTLGMSSFALIIIAIIKPFALRIISPREGFETGMELNVFTLKIGPYITYAGILLFVYHFSYFIIESMNIKSVFFILIKSIISTIFAIGFSLLFQYLIFNKK